MIVIPPPRPWWFHRDGVYLGDGTGGPYAPENRDATERFMRDVHHLLHRADVTHVAVWLTGSGLMWLAGAVTARTANGARRRALRITSAAVAAWPDAVLASGLGDLEPLVEEPTAP